MDTRLLDEIKQATDDLGLSLEDTMNDMARKYLREIRRKRLAIEQEHYTEMHATLKETHYGQHVAIYNGELVDHDTDLSALAQRIKKRFGRLPVMITEVGDEPITIYTTHSFRVVGAK